MKKAINIATTIVIFAICAVILVIKDMPYAHQPAVLYTLYFAATAIIAISQFKPEYFSLTKVSGISALLVATACVPFLPVVSWHEKFTFDWATTVENIDWMPFGGYGVGGLIVAALFPILIGFIFNQIAEVKESAQTA